MSLHIITAYRYYHNGKLIKKRENESQESR